MLTDYRFKTVAWLVLGLLAVGVLVGPWVVAHAALVARIAAAWTALIVLFVILWHKGVIRPR